ncbi:Conserved domain protein, partial CDS, partial [Neorhizobium galegae bv. officinalis]
MKFYIESLQLWLKTGKRRSVSFLPNKVNVITGDSHTGKTAILDIVDYCMFASKHRISESIINENVGWYGLRIHLNEKIYMLARRAPVGTTPSPDYYFSSTGEVPDTAPSPNISESVLKKLLSADFGIDQDVRIPFGGRTLQANSRVSLRYFLLFNTISQDIITHSDQFFDKQNQARYQEALPRIFDIAVGIDTVENILKREKRAELERSLARQQKLSAKTEEMREQFNAQLAETVARAKGYGLVAEDTDADASVTVLTRMVTERESGPDLHVSAKYEEISSEIYRVSRKIRGLRRFVSEYGNHKATLKETADSLQPVEHLMRNFEETVRTSVFDDILRNLSKGLQEIKDATARKTPLDGNIAEIIKELESQRGKLEKDLQALPAEMESFESDKDKYIFIGETKAKLELYSEPESDKAPDNSELIASLEAQIEDLAVSPVEDRKELFTRALDEAIQDYISLTKAALGNYGDYRSAFNYSEKKLHLR